MSEHFAEILAVGGKSNSLGRASEVIESVLEDKSRLGELYDCLFDEDAWTRMRAADSLEKVCREHPEWLQPYIDRFPRELAASSQPSIQWHLAQIYAEVELSEEQRQFAIKWLKGLLSTTEVDWIVAANAMDTLHQFTKEGYFPVDDLIKLVHIQQGHKSNSVIKRANKLLDILSVKEG